MIIRTFSNSTLDYDPDLGHTTLEELLVFTGLVLWTLQGNISDSLYTVYIEGLMLSCVRYFVMLLFLTAIMLTEKSYRIRLLALLAAGGIFLLELEHMAADGINLLQLFLMVLACRNVSFRKVCRVMFWSGLACFLLIIAGSWSGLIYREPMSFDSDRMREYLGYIYPTFGPIRFFGLTACGLYGYTDPSAYERDQTRSRGVPWPVLIIACAVNLVLYELTDTNLILFIVLAFLILYALCVKCRLDLFHDCFPIRLMAAVIMPALCAFVWYISDRYNANIPMWVRIDEFSHSRVRLNHQGIVKYGVHLLGQQVVVNSDQTDMDKYFYIDSGYMKALLSYGIIFTALLLLVYMLIFRAAIRIGDRVLCIWIFCIALYSVFNNLLTSPLSNCSFLGIWYAARILRDYSRKKREGTLEAFYEQSQC